MKNIKSVNSQVFRDIVAVSKQKELEFNNGQDGAIILSLLVMFFTPFLLLNEVRQFLQIDYSFAAMASIAVVSLILTVILYKMFKISQKFADKETSLNSLLSMYVPNNKAEFERFKAEIRNEPTHFFELVNEWISTEKLTYAK
ncbi:hypothetical protein [Providencia manganoxydans]|uniref:hypothetical protein n=1 Tax=Providencia manganoxydans TaxID=2923283 RepID=UPI0034E5B5FC